MRDASTDVPGTTANTVLYLRSDCDLQASELACSNDVVAATNLRSTITASVPAGVYYLVVDSITVGAFALHVELLAGEGQACAGPGDCGPGLVCRVPVGQSAMVCSDPVCSDGADDDGDTLADYPNDPGCDGPADASEDDLCPTDPSCPQCGNDLDDDGNGQTDYPADTSCGSASQAVEGCTTEQDPLFVLSAGTLTGDSTGLSHDFVLSCGGAGGADRVYLASLPAMTTITFDTLNSEFDTVLAVFPSTCTGAELGCNDDGDFGLGSLLTLTDVPAGAYAVVVSSYSGGNGGVYTLQTTGRIAAGGRCDGALASSGAFTCNAGSCIAGTCQ
jgi:hypothetical protein